MKPCPLARARQSKNSSATVGNYKLEIKVAPWGEGELKVNGKKVSRVDNAKDRRQAFRQLADGAEQYLKEQAFKAASNIKIPTAKAKLLEGKRGLIVGIANDRVDRLGMRQGVPSARCGDRRHLSDR